MHNEIDPTDTHTEAQFYQWLTFTCNHFLCWPSPSGHALRWRIVAISLFRGLLKKNNNSGVQAQVTKIFS